MVSWFMNKADFLKLQAELASQKVPKRNKYNNKVVHADGFKFDSDLEYRRYLELKILVKAGKISDLRLQVKYELAEPVSFEFEARQKRSLAYIADFVYFDNETKKTVVEDAKSKATKKNSTYRIKKHLMKSIHGIEVIEICSIRA